jgi:signal peptidase I
LVALLAAGCGHSGDGTATAGVAPTTAASTGSLPAGAGVPYRVPSASMEPTLTIGETVIVRKVQVSVGEVVVFHPPEAFLEKLCGPRPHRVVPGAAACAAPVPEVSKLRLIKRVLAGPGDEMYIREGHVFRRVGGSGPFVRDNDAATRGCAVACDFPQPIKIPADHWFLMGDNRAESNDSRFWGPVPSGWIAGVATAR